MSMSMTGARGAAGDILPKGQRTGQMQQFTPEQMELFKNTMSMAGPGSQLAQMASGSDEAFAPFEKKAMRGFQEMQGSNASRFSGMGMGARRSSGFQNFQNQSTEDFATNLAMQRQALQRQALMDLQGISSSLLQQRPYERFMIKKSQPWWKEFLLGLNERGEDLAQQGVKYGASFI